MYNKIKIKIVGKNISYFLKEIIKRNINIYEIVKDKNSITLTINYKDYQEIKKIKTTYKIIVIEEYGIRKLKSIIQRKKLLIISLILGVLLSISLSHMVLKIEINHPNKELVSKIKKDLEEIGLKEYKFKVSYKEKEKIKNKLLEKEKEILEWIEIEEKGTKYIINIEERKQSKKEESCNYRHIVSKKNALILEIEASSGEIIKKKNDYVEKGEILISGFIYNKENIVSKRCSIGKVYGETWYKIKLLIPKKYQDEKLTNKKNIGISLKIINKEYNLLNKLRVYEKKEYNIIDSKIIPISIGICNYQEKIINNKKYSIHNIDNIALNIAEQELKKRLNKDEIILGKKVLKKTENNSKIEIEVFLKAKENITEYIDITDIDIEELNKKEE